MLPARAAGRYHRALGGGGGRALDFPDLDIQNGGGAPPYSDTLPLHDPHTFRMTAAEWMLVAVFMGTMVLMFGTRLRSDVVAILAALALALTGVIDDGAVFQGLSSTVVLTLLALFVMAEGLENTGVIRWAAHRLANIGGNGKARVQLTLMSTATVLSLGMTNVAVGALVLPASIRVARTSRVPVSALLIPVSFATLLGGMATIFTSANIIMSDLLVQQGGRALTMLDYAITGGFVAVAGIMYMMAVGRRLLPERRESADDPLGDCFGLYKLGERFWEFEVRADSVLAGKTVEEIGFRERFGLSVLAIRRRHRTFLVPGPGIGILAGDRVVVLGQKERVRELVHWGVELRTGASPGDLQEELELTEIVVPPRSRAEGETLTDLELRTRYGVTVLALWREGEVIRTDVGTTPLQIGDGLRGEAERPAEVVGRVDGFVAAGAEQQGVCEAVGQGEGGDLGETLGRHLPDVAEREVVEHDWIGQVARQLPSVQEAVHAIGVVEQEQAALDALERRPQLGGNAHD